jgi:hypothetical protein
MSSPLDTVLDNLSEGLVVLVGAVASVSRPPQEAASGCWGEAARVIHALYTDLKIYKALFKLRFSDFALVGRDSSHLGRFSKALLACNGAVQSTVAQLSTEHSSGAHNPPGMSVDPLHGTQEGGSGLTANLVKQRTELGQSFVLIWLESLPNSSLIHAVATPLPPSPLNNTDLGIMQSDNSALPNSKPSRRLFQPPPLPMDGLSLENFLTAAHTTAQEVGKQWAKRMGIQVDESNRLLPLLPIVLGSIFCVTLEEEPSLPTSFAPSIASLRSLICNTLVGMSEGISSIALLGTAGSGKSLLIDSLIGSRLLISGSTFLMCMMRAPS